MKPISVNLCGENCVKRLFEFYTNRISLPPMQLFCLFAQPHFICVKWILFFLTVTDQSLDTRRTPHKYAVTRANWWWTPNTPSQNLYRGSKGLLFICLYKSQLGQRAILSSLPFLVPSWVTDYCKQRAAVWNPAYTSLTRGIIRF